MNFGFWADLKGLQFHDAAANTAWIQAMPLGTYHHPIYGEIKLTEARSKRFADNVNNNVVGTALDIDYDHKATTGAAAGWVKQAESRGAAGLHLLVEFTQKAADAIRAGEWRYFSPEFQDKWKHPKTQQEFEDVLRGGGLTNRPFLKDILPVNLSELSFVPENKEVGVTPKELRESLGLAETATDDEVRAKLKELKDKEPPTPPAPPTNEPPKVELDDKLKGELAKLVEGNPALKALTDLVTTQAQQLSTLQETIKRDSVARKLADVDKGKIAMSPAAKEAMQNILLGENVAAGAEAFLKLLSDGTALVETGERGGGDPTTLGETDSEKLFDKAIEDLMAKNPKMEYADAVTEVSRSNPKLFQEYRDASTAFKA